MTRMLGAHALVALTRPEIDPHAASHRSSGNCETSPTRRAEAHAATKEILRRCPRD